MIDVVARHEGDASGNQLDRQLGPCAEPETIIDDA